MFLAVDGALCIHHVGPRSGGGGGGSGGVLEVVEATAVGGAAAAAPAGQVVLRDDEALTRVEELEAQPLVSSDRLDHVEHLARVRVRVRIRVFGFGFGFGFRGWGSELSVSGYDEGSGWGAGLGRAAHHVLDREHARGDEDVEVTDHLWSGTTEEGGGALVRAVERREPLGQPPGRARRKGGRGCRVQPAAAPRGGARPASG